MICTVHTGTSGLKFTGPVCVAHRVGDRITMINSISVVAKGFELFVYVTIGCWTAVVLLFWFFYFCFYTYIFVYYNKRRLCRSALWFFIWLPSSRDQRRIMFGRRFPCTRKFHLICIFIWLLLSEQLGSGKMSQRFPQLVCTECFVCKNVHTKGDLGKQKFYRLTFPVIFSN